MVIQAWIIIRFQHNFIVLRSIHLILMLPVLNQSIINYLSYSILQLFKLQHTFANYSPNTIQIQLPAIYQAIQYQCIITHIIVLALNCAYTA